MLKPANEMRAITDSVRAEQDERERQATTAYIHNRIAPMIEEAATLGASNITISVDIDDFSEEHFRSVLQDTYQYIIRTINWLCYRISW